MSDAKQDIEMLLNKYGNACVRIGAGAGCFDVAASVHREDMTKAKEAILTHVREQAAYIQQLERERKESLKAIERLGERVAHLDLLVAKLAGGDQ